MKAPKNINYCATVVKINNIIPLANCDNVVATTILGNNVIVSKSVAPGDIGLFFPVETRLSDEYLKANNLFKHPEKNLDPTQKGYFEDNGRIRCVRFRGHASEGIYMPIESIDFCSSRDNLHVGDVFDELEGTLLCEKYIVIKRNSGASGNTPKQRNPRISKLIDNQFKFHNDTAKLYNNLHMLSPDDLIAISYKVHGTSFISSNILCKKPLKWYERALKRIGIDIVSTFYDNVYASRKVVKNAELNPNAQHFYGEDIWGIANSEIKPFLLEGMTVYGEIAGFLPGGGYIQKDFDYGCEPGQHKKFIYRITYTNPSGKVFEFSMKQVQDWCQLNGLLAVPLLYYGTAKDFVDKFEVLLGDTSFGGNTLTCNVKKEFSSEEFLARVKQLYNEKDCYLCVNKVPEEGAVVRIEKLGLEAYKVKSTRFLEYETKCIDKGEINMEDEG